MSLHKVSPNPSYLLNYLENLFYHRGEDAAGESPLHTAPGQVLHACSQLGMRVQIWEHPSAAPGAPSLALNYPQGALLIIMDGLPTVLKLDLPCLLTRDGHFARDQCENQHRRAQSHISYIPAGISTLPTLVFPPAAISTQLCLQPWSISFPAPQQPEEGGINPCLFCKARLEFSLGHLLNSWSAPCIQGNLSQPAAYREASLGQVSLGSQHSWAEVLGCL